MEPRPPSVETKPIWVAPGIIVTRAGCEFSDTDSGSSNVEELATNNFNLADGKALLNTMFPFSEKGKSGTPKPIHSSENDTLQVDETTRRPRCEKCGKWFHSRQQLSQHELVHSDVRKYKCRFCDRAFKQPSHLHQHHRIHTGEKPYKCTISGCNRAFPQLSNLNHHIRNHDKPDPPPENTCVFCDRAYASETVLRTHLKKIHGCSLENMSATRSTNNDSVKKEKPMCSLNNNVTSQGIPVVTPIHNYVLTSIEKKVEPTISHSVANGVKTITFTTNGTGNSVMKRKLYPKSLPAPKTLITNPETYGSVLNGIHNGNTLNGIHNGNTLNDIHKGNTLRKTCFDLAANGNNNVDDCGPVLPLKKARLAVSNESVLTVSGVNNVPNSYVSGIYIQPYANAGNSIQTLDTSNLNRTELNGSPEDEMEFIEDISVMQYNYTLGDDIDDLNKQSNLRSDVAPSQTNGTVLNGHTGVDHTGVDHTGVGHTGYCHTGVGHTGNGQSGVGHTGVGHTGNVQSGVGHAGVGHTGVDHTGVGHTGVDHTGVDHTGVGHTGVDHTRTGHTGVSYTGVGHTGNGYTGVGHTGAGHTGVGHTGVNHTGNGYTGVGQSGVDNTGNGHTGNGHTGNGHTRNGQSGNGHTDVGYTGNGHTGVGHTRHGQSGNVHTGNGAKGNGNTGNAHTGVKLNGYTNYPTRSLTGWTDVGDNASVEENITTAPRSRKRKASQPQRFVYAIQE